MAGTENSPREKYPGPSAPDGTSWAGPAPADYALLNKEILDLFTQAHNRKAYLEQLAELLSTRTGCPYLGIRVRDKEGHISYEAYRGYSQDFLEQESCLSLEEDSCICTRIALAKPQEQEYPYLTPFKSFCCNNTEALKDLLVKDSYRGTCIKYGFRSLAVIPILRRGESLGVIHLADKTADTLPKGLVELVESLVPLIAEAMYRFTVEEELQRNYEQQQVLYALQKLLQEETDLKGLLDQALATVLTIPWLDKRGSIFLMEKNGKTLFMAAQHGMLQELRANCARISLGHCLCGQAAGLKQIQFASYADLLKDDHWLKTPHGHYCLPILFGENTLGVLNLYLPAEHTRKTREETFLMAVANTLAGIIKHRQAEEALRKSEAGLAKAQKIARLGHWEWDLEEGQLSWSEEVYRIFNLDPEAFSPSYEAFLQMTHPEDRETVEKAVAEALAHNKPYRLDHRIVRPDGSVAVIHEQADLFFDAGGKAVRMLGTVQDITERKRMEEQLKHLATHDPLTNIPNRYMLEENLKRVVARAKRGAQSALMVVDIDNFSLLNESQGFAAGDMCLIKLVSFLQENLREEDLVARLGGDEFAVLLEGQKVEEALPLAERIRSNLDETELGFKLSLSIGVIAIDGLLDPQKLLSRVSIGLDAAKAESKNRTVLLDSREEPIAFQSETYEMFKLVAKALKEERFVLYCQPVIDLSRGKVSHYEVLLRLRDKKKLIPPGQFIPLAEKFGLMPRLDYWVISKALTYLKANPELKLFVNLSGVSMGDEGLLNQIAQEIGQSGINPAQLGMEITETAAVKDLVQAERWIKKLRGMGCRFALDDFGIGFSSFSYLKLLSVDCIKIDGFFIRNIDKDEDQRHIVQAINFIARSMGKTTIAEFVENERIFKALKDLEVDLGQGYYFGRPAPLSAAPSP